MLATNRHPSSTFLILKIIFSKKRKGETNPPQRAKDKKSGEEGRGKRKEGVKRQGRRQKSYHSPTISYSGSQCSDAKVQIIQQSPS